MSPPVAIALSTKEKTELSRQVAPPLIDAARKGKILLFWFDGSTSMEGVNLPFEMMNGNSGPNAIHTNVVGGADTAIAYALTTLLNHPNNYAYVGLHENDVLHLDSEWFEKTMALFKIGKRDGLKVGAVSTRCYEDRILIARDGYAVMHNLGAGQVIFSRQAAEIVLRHMRTGWTHVNRSLFAQLSGIDIGGYWAFRGAHHVLGADWHFDTVLAAHGLASLALVPSPVEMIGQVPPLEEQGLTIVKGDTPITDRHNDKAFERFVERTKAIRGGTWKASWPGLFHSISGQAHIFPHQVAHLGGSYDGDWHLRWLQAWGPFVWRAEEGATLSVPVSGACELLISGGKDGGKVSVSVPDANWHCEPELIPEGNDGQVLAFPLPPVPLCRTVELKALTPGICFCGIKCMEPQPQQVGLSFDHSWLPPI